MISRIREVRKAKSMTLEQVALRCDPPTTAQTIGRLETGTRTLSVDWLNRIADALGVDSAALVEHGEREDVAVAAILGGNGVHAPEKRAIAMPPTPSTALVAVKVAASVGDYRAGDEIWCRKLAAEDYGKALNRDVLVPRPAGRFLFGRMIDRDGDKFLLLPITAGGRQQVVSEPAWIAVAETLVRAL